MKTKILVFTFLISSSIHSYGQDNPIENLTWSHWYEYPQNFFELTWEEPAQPHDELLGYNVYRNNELYRFQTEMTIYNYWTPLYGIVTNCGGESFFNANDGEYFDDGFEVYVTAVYAGPIESAYTQTVFIEGLLLGNKQFTPKKVFVYPNPTSGIINIGSENLEKIIVYDISGKIVRELAPTSQIDLSNLSKGIYVLKRFTKNEIFVDKIVIQ